MWTPRGGRVRQYTTLAGTVLARGRPSTAASASGRRMARGSAADTVWRSVMDKQVPVDPSARADRGEHDGVHEVGPNLALQRLAIVNVVYVGRPNAKDGEWVLVDAGVVGTGAALRAAAESRFGTRPAAIVMT